MRQATCPWPLLPYLRRIPDRAEDMKERGMQKPRSLYTHDHWVERRSFLRHLRHLLLSLSSRVILSLIPPVFTLTAVDATLAFLPLLRAPPLPYQLTALALALLLAFGAEALYSRFQEGRSALMKVMTGTSELSGMVISLGSSGLSVDAYTKKALLNYIMDYSHGEMEPVNSLRGPLASSSLRLSTNTSLHRTKLSGESISRCLSMVGVLIEEPFSMLTLDELCEQVLGTMWGAPAMQILIHDQVLAKRKTHLEENSPNGRPYSSTWRSIPRRA
ncbi:unnamed protein product [Spirodela intermedia]|uniref:Uncharacterized protein n=1 Tax=Spirodela intermedia TaxID=51605 RepID=A0A7I8LL20_SPIIN|nr:unnamed protein product [Spirodela intermedia]